LGFSDATWSGPIEYLIQVWILLALTDGYFEYFDFQDVMNITNERAIFYHTCTSD
jgi:hypothetical protein